jgi:hypothetical protein
MPFLNAKENLTHSVLLSFTTNLYSVLRGEKSRFQLFGDTVNMGKDALTLIGPCSLWDCLF